MPSRLKRYQTFDQDHFITFTCYHRFPFLDNGRARDTFEEVLETLRERHQFLIHGYVVMPNHVDLLLSEPKLHLLADTMRALKTETSKRLKGDRPHFWQRRYYDFNIITRPKFIEKLRYTHRNPVHDELVENLEDWPLSSYRHWLTGEEGKVHIESNWTWNARIDPNKPLMDQNWR